MVTQMTTGKGPFGVWFLLVLLTKYWSPWLLCEAQWCKAPLLQTVNPGLVSYGEDQPFVLLDILRVGREVCWGVLDSLSQFPLWVK